MRTGGRTKPKPRQMRGGGRGAPKGRSAPTGRSGINPGNRLGPRQKSGGMCSDFNGTNADACICCNPNDWTGDCNGPNGCCGAGARTNCWHTDGWGGYDCLLWGGFQDGPFTCQGQEDGDYWKFQCTEWGCLGQGGDDGMDPQQWECNFVICDMYGGDFGPDGQCWCYDVYDNFCDPSEDCWDCWWSSGEYKCRCGSQYCN